MNDPDKRLPEAQPQNRAMKTLTHWAIFIAVMGALVGLGMLMT